MEYTRLSICQRLEIQMLLQRGAGQSAIARRIRVHRSTVSHEIRRNSIEEGIYIARYAHALAKLRKMREYKAPVRSFFRRPRRFRKSWMLFRKSRLRQRKDQREMRERLCKAWRMKRRKCYVWKKDFDQQCLREWYLRHRKRDHLLEKWGRMPRTLEDFRSYRKTGNSLRRRAKPALSSRRHYTLSRQGMLRGPYRRLDFWHKCGLRKKSKLSASRLAGKTVKQGHSKRKVLLKPSSPRQKIRKTARLKPFKPSEMITAPFCCMPRRKEQDFAVSEPQSYSLFYPDLPSGPAALPHFKPTG
jgi:hypothetical protein